MVVEVYLENHMMKHYRLFQIKKFYLLQKGLKLETRLSDEVYTSPLDGLFTTKEWADAIKQGDEILATGLAKSAVYRYLVLVPKGLTQVGKTVLGPVTQIRNFTSNFLQHYIMVIYYTLLVTLKNLLILLKKINRSNTTTIVY